MDNNGLPTHRLGLGDAVLRREWEATQLTETGSPGLGDSQTKNHDISIMDGVRAFGAGALSITELAGYASGRLADALADTNVVGRAYSNMFRPMEAIGNIAGAAKERVESGLSDDAQAARELPFFEEDERGKITGIGDGMRELDVVALKFAEGLGSIVPTLVAGGGMGAVAHRAIMRRAAQAGYTKGQAEYIAATAQAQLASKVTGGAAATGVGTAAHIGGAGKELIEDLKQLPAETRIMSESGKRIYGQVLSEEEWKDKTPLEQQEEMFRRQELELSGAVMTDPRTVALGVAGTVLGDVGLLNMLSGAGKQAAKSTIGGGIASSALKGFGMEGAAEGLQGGGQQYLTNEQLIEQAGSDVAPWKGVASSALEEGIIGGLSGGAIGGYSGSRNNKARKQLESAEQQQSELDQQQTDAEVENQTERQESAPAESADGPAEITITPEIDRSDLPQVVPSDDARVGREFAFPAGSGDVYQVIESMGGQMYRVANLNAGETLNINTGEARGGLQIDSLIAQYEQNKGPEAQEVNGTGDATRTESNPLGPSQSEFDERRDIPSYLRQGGDIDGRDVQPIWSDDEAQQALSRGESAPTVDELIQQEQTQPSEQEQRQIDAAIQSAGFEADGIWRELSNLRVTKRGKPFASEKEAQMASRKDEQPVKLPEGYGVAKQAEVAEAQESLAKQSQMTESEREQQPAKQTQVAGGSIVEANVASLKLSSDVPQFKDGANKDGIVEALGGTFDRTGVAPIQVWQRNNGDMEVISGRHRLDLARRSGEKTIPAQVHKESDGFDRAAAATLDAELNIRDNQGKVKDYVQYFQATGIDRAEADRRGYTARALGRRAHTIATEGSEETIAAHSAGRITDEGAERISQTAPGDARLQAVGVKSIQDGKSITHATNMMQAVKALSGGQQGDGMGDMFGFDDSGMREAEQMATLAASKQREINELLRPQRAVSRSGKRAEQEGITDNLSPEQRKERMENLQELKAAWDNWSTNPELVAELRSEIKGEEAPALSTYSEADLQQQADQLKQSQQAEQVEQGRYDADQELDGFNLTGSDSAADVAMAQGQADIFADAPRQEGSKPVAARPQATSAIADNGDTNQAPQGGNAISRMSPRERNVGTISYISNADKGAIERWIDSNRITDEQLRGVIDRGYTSAELRNIIESNLHPELDLTDVAQRGDRESAASQLKPESRLDTAADKISAKKIEAAKKLKKLIDSRKGSLNSGVDPEVMLAVAEVGALSIAEGAVKFAQYVRDVLTTTQAVGLNDADVKPFLKESYAAISANPEKYGVSDADADNMQAPRELRKIDIDELARPAEQATQEPDNDQRTTADTTTDRANQDDGPAKTGSDIQHEGRGSSGQRAGEAGQESNLGPLGVINSLDDVRADLDRDQAKAIDPYTFKKDGGYFIREKHLSDQPLDLATFKNLSSTITTDAKPAGISVSQAQSVADAFLKAYKGNIPLEVIIRDTQEELYGPEATIANVKQIKGAYHPARGVFTLAASNLSSMQDVIETIRHEVLGHYGLNTFTPADKRKILDQLIEARDTKGPLADIWSEIDKLYPDDTSDIRAEEVFARVVELEPAKVGKLKAFVDRLLHNLNVAMRRVGLVKGPLKLNDVRRTARYVAEGIRSGRRKQQTLPVTDDALFRLGDSTTTTDSALDKLNLGPKPDVIDKAKERVKALREMDRKTASSWITRVGRKANTEMLDALAPIKYVEEALGINDADNSGYIASRLATGSSSTMLGAMLHGLPVWKDGVIQRKKGSTEKDALLGVIEPLGKDLHNWLGWMAGHRAELLMEQGRENLLTDDEIQGLKALGKGKERQFNEAKQKWNTFNGAILDLAQESGLVSAESRANFESEWYIPFFREDDDGDVLAPFTNKGTANQRSGIKQLKGGTNKTNDLLENIFHTTGKMIDASMKNHAARKTVENLMDTGIIEVIENPNLMDMRAKDKGQEVFTIRHKGEDVYVRTLDKDLFRAMTFLDRKPFDDPFTKVGMSAKRLLTATVTSSPEFMLRNFLRDMLSAWVISKDDYNPLDAFKGALKAYKMDGGAMDMMFAGSSFMGGYVNANDPQGMADTVRKGLRRKGLSPEQITKYEKSIVRNASQAKGVIADAWAKYNRYGEAAENATREAVYAAAIKDGKSKAQAAFDAKDQMDFSMLGASRTLQWLTAVLPFFNARIQGLGKLSREFKDNPAGVAKRGGYIVAGTMALLASNWDRKEYEELPDWDKDMHWHIWLGDQHFRVPKPFEVGVIFGTIPERAVRAMGDKDTGAEFGKAVVRAMAETFALNPIPQAVNPIAEVAFNYDSFKGRAIESQYDARLRPEARYDERTSLAMRELGDALGISPKKAEHLVRGYLGSMGAYAMMAADMMISAGKDEGSSPEIKIWEWPVVKAVYQGDGSSPAKSTKQISQLYEMLDKVTELHNTVNAYRKDNRIEDANRLVEKKGKILNSRSSLTNAQRQLRQIRNQMDMIRRDRKLTGEQKRERIDRLLTRRNDLASRAVQQNKEWFE